MRFSEGKRASDPAVMRAVLSAPAWLCGVSEHAYAFVRSQLEHRAPAEIVAERKRVIEALAEIDLGFRAARSRVAKEGGLEPALGKVA